MGYVVFFTFTFITISMILWLWYAMITFLQVLCYEEVSSRPARSLVASVTDCQLWHW